MYLDAQLLFSTAQAVTVTAASSSVVDLTGYGVGVVPTMSFGTSSSGAPQTSVSDMGIGDGMAVPKIFAAVGTAFASTGGAATLQIAAQFAPDSGTGTAGTYKTYAQTDVYALADLVASASIGTFDLPRAPSRLDGTLTDYPLARFIRLNYTVATTSFSAGTLNAAIVLGQDMQLAAVNNNSNFVVAP